MRSRTRANGHNGGNPSFFTIGYQLHSVQSLIRTLSANRVEVLVDVRHNPVSRKTGFSRRQLEEALAKVEIQYLHRPCLGAPPSIRRSCHGNGRIGEALRAYEKYLASKTARLEALIQTVTSRRLCLLCLESDHNLCHRGVIARRICEMTQWNPVHLT
jgi:uncharacterized protein (DUF488 family)